MLPRQVAGRVASPLLFTRKVTHFAPRDLLELLVEQLAEIVPRRRTQGVITRIAQPQQMADRKRAAVGDHRQLQRLQMFLDQRQLFVHGGASVLIAVDRVAEQRQRTEFIDEGAQPDMRHPRTLGSVVGAAAFGDVSRFERRVAVHHVAVDDAGPRLGLFVHAFKENVRGIVMQFVERHVEAVRDFQSQRRENGMALVEERIERSSQSIIVDLLDRHVPDDVGRGVSRPLADVGQRTRRTDSRSEEKTEHGAMIELSLRISRQMLINHLSDFHLFDQRHDNRERAKRTAFDIDLISIPRAIHVISLVAQARWRKFSFERKSGCGK